MKFQWEPAWQALRSWTQRQPKAVVIAGVAGLLIGLWFLYVPPLLEVGRLRQTWKGLHAEVEQARHVLDQVRSEAIEPLPQVEAVPELLSELHAVAQEYQLELLEVTPQSVSDAAPQEAVLLPLELLVRGNYRSLGEFLGSLPQSASLGAVFVRSVQISRDPGLLPRLTARLSLELALGQENHGSN